MKTVATCAIFGAMLLLPAGTVVAANSSGIAIDGIIVKFKTHSTHFRKFAQTDTLTPADAAELSTSAMMPLSVSRAMSGNAHLMTLHSKLAPRDVDAIAARLARHPDVEYAVPNRRKFPHRVPNDELYAFQWNYSDPVSGINLPAAWDITTGAANVIVAIADTGSRPHPDAAPGLPGYDFITDPVIANDGDGRDASPLDPGDGVTLADMQSHPELSATTSSWHGEFVAGIVGALSNDTIGIAGVNWNARILHVRVLGRGGGDDADILDGIRWAAGFSVPGVPDNPNPAHVINMSLGGNGPCDASYQDAFNSIITAGKVIVLSAGNESDDVSKSSPANCSGAIVVVAATARNGGRASYSNFGSVAGAITLAAPGGDGVTTDRILSLSNTGSYAPADNAYLWKAGTSFSAPHVSGVVALMLAVNAGLTPAQVVQILRDSARVFPAAVTNACDTVKCGAGILDAAAAVTRAKQTAAAISPATGWWWNPNEAGRGFAIEKQGNNLLMGSYLYEAGGRATWYGSGPGAMNGSGYAGVLTSYGGGQTLTGAYKSASVTGSGGNISVNFTSSTQGTLTWPGGTIPVQRFDFGAGGSTATQPTGTPEAGWWWAPTEGGRGYALEIQGNSMLFAGYMYDTQGNPIWYASGPVAMTATAAYQGSWQQYANGQTLTGNWHLPQVLNTNVGSITLQFSSTTNAILTLPDGRQIAITRYRY